MEQTLQSMQKIIKRILNLRKTIRNNVTIRKYNLYNTINANIRETLKDKIQNNELNNKRNMAYIVAIFEGNKHFTPFLI